MNPHTLHVLEFETLLDLLASFAAAEPGKAWLRALSPRPTPPRDAAWQPLVQAFIDLRQREISPCRAAFDSPADALQRVAPKGAVLEVEQLLTLRLFIRQLRQVREFLRSEPVRPFRPAVELGEQLHDFPDLHRILERTFDDKGEVQDDASEALQGIRRRLRALERRIHQRLELLLQDPDLGDVFHDRFVAIRNQRYVVPVKRDLKGKLRGVVHDQSNTGRTVFMEPELTLADGNELASLRFEERDEVLRILAAISDFVRACRDQLAHCVELLTLYDAVCAISAWADTCDCHFARTGSRLLLRQARHPLLAHQLRLENRAASLVALDLEMPAGSRVMAITGSNTGGKTVILKTIGLLALAHQAGLPIPAAAATTIPWFPDVLADIGDEQSLQQSLSTFSGHLKNISAILAAADAGQVLVLLDELGSGTDPIEGGALGCAILDTLAEGQATVFVTTHLGMIKSYVHAHEQMVNASVRFNAETLRPEYVLDIGRPGASHALLVAGRCGVPEHVLARARDLVSAEHLSMEDMLASIEEKERHLQDELDAAQNARDSAARDRDSLRSELDELRAQRKQLLHDAHREAGAIVDNTRRQMENLLEKARHLGHGDQARTLRQTIRRKEKALTQGIEETAPRVAARVRQDELEVGLKVWVAALNDHATIVSLTADRKRATVEVGGMRFDIKTAQIGQAKSGAESPEPARVQVRAPRGPVNARLELNLIGLRVEQALPRLERFLDEALMAGLSQVRIIHGFGTGQLRKGVHEYLDASPAVLNYRLGLPEKDPGGSGATIVQLS